MFCHSTKSSSMGLTFYRDCANLGPQLQGKLAHEGPYQANIEVLRLRLPELQAEDHETQTIRKQGLKKSWEDVDRVLDWKDIFYVLRVIWTELICRHYDNVLASHFDIKKTRELIVRKYYWPMLRANIESYVKGYNMCLASKLVNHKPYGNLQSLPVPTHW